MTEAKVNKFVLILLFSLALVVRLSLVMYAQWHDDTFKVPFTDVDYFVLDDSASEIFNNGLFFGSPYERLTFRYTPLFSYIMIPNHVFGTKAFGKIIFVLFDLIAGYILLILPTQHGGAFSLHRTIWTFLLWMFNPFVIGISTRGNAEAIICSLIISFLYFHQKKRYFVSALLFGLSVHVKVFPIIYTWPILCGFISSRENDGREHDHGEPKRRTPMIARVLPLDFIKFGLASGLTFAGLGAVFYWIYGYDFLYETYIYHLVRKDHRHNLSIYFYYFYLTLGGSPSAAGSDPAASTLTSSLVHYLCFIPQLLLLLQMGKKFSSNLPFSCLIMTMIFVTYNKVCTSQYFLWYTCLLPLVCAHISMPWRKITALAALWVVAQGIWLGLAYSLEFLGQNVYFELFLASCFFFVVNNYVILSIMDSYREEWQK